MTAGDVRYDETVDGHAATEQVADELAARPAPSSREPDVFVDLPQLRVEGVSLQLEDLGAEVSLAAKVLDLLQLNVGAEATLGRLELDVERVDVQAQVKVRLDDLALIIDRVLATIDRNPQIIQRLVAGLGGAVEQVAEGAGRAVDELGAGAGAAVEDVGEGAGSAVEDLAEGAESTAENLSEGLRPTD